jgi:hypothetical protein
MGFRPAGNAFKPNTAGPFFDISGRGGVLHFLAAAAVARPTPRRRLDRSFPWHFADLPVAVIQSDDRRIAERLGLPAKTRALDTPIHFGYFSAIPTRHHRSPVLAEIFNRTGQQSGVVTEKTKPCVAFATEKAALTIGFVAVIAGKGFASAPFQFVLLKLAANVAARGLRFRPF